MSIELFHPRYWLTWLGLFLLILSAQLPFRLQLWIGRLLGRLLYRLLKSRRLVTLRNLELCFPDWSDMQYQKMAKRHFESNGMAIMETGMAWFMPYSRLKNRFVIKGRENWEAIQSTSFKHRGKGALIMAIHFNTLEITNVAINRLFDMSMSYRPHDNPVYDLIQRKGRERHNINSRAIDRRDIRGMVKAMEAGDWLWYAADQDYGPKVSEFIPWFGIPAATVSAPPRLAGMADVPVVGITYKRLPDYHGYEIHFLPAFENLPSGDNQADLVRLNQHFEHCIRENIEEYLWVHRRFKTRPGSENNLYEF